jgi:hypothetical protein
VIFVSPERNRKTGKQKTHLALRIKKTHQIKKSVPTSHTVVTHVSTQSQYILCHKQPRFQNKSTFPSILTTVLLLFLILLRWNLRKSSSTGFSPLYFINASHQQFPLKILLVPALLSRIVRAPALCWTDDCLAGGTLPAVGNLDGWGGWREFGSGGLRIDVVLGCSAERNTWSVGSPRAVGWEVWLFGHCCCFVAVLI